VLLDLLECWRGTPFIVGVADQVPPKVNIGFVRRIAAQCRQVPA
jgi:hypothetical protein